jgi:hypothetical protein
VQEENRPAGALVEEREHDPVTSNPHG